MVQTSIGIACTPPTPPAAETLLQEADIALYQAKTFGKGRAVLFDPVAAARTLERLDLEADLRHALAAGQLRVVYQPIVDMHGRTLRGVEALLRWDHPRRGAIPPGDFIPLAEETGLILPIGAWVLGESCRQMALWRAYPALRDAFVSVNLSTRQLRHPDLVEQVARVLAETGLPPAGLALEITEGAIAQDLEAAVSALGKLRDLGVRLAIDDVGGSSSSLSYLRRLPVDMLKVDRSFIAGLEDAGTTAVLDAIGAVGRALGMEVTAEGIETETELAAVRALAFDRGQGFFFAHPAAPTELTPGFARGLPYPHDTQVA
jgi:EAL domain-containing protein (putative c-di-GMP-specific phosphodiesterase class I)